MKRYMMALTVLVVSFLSLRQALKTYQLRRSLLETQQLRVRLMAFLTEAEQHREALLKVSEKSEWLDELIERTKGSLTQAENVIQQLEQSVKDGRLSEGATTKNLEPEDGTGRLFYRRTG
jgi:hypothetical protein